MISTINLNGIQIFVAIVEQGNFSKAAIKLNLSSSAVSKAVTTLEDRLGVSLFHRTTRILKLTEDGASYYESCVKALSELTEGQERLVQQKQKLEGRVHMNLPVLFGKKWILPIIMDLSKTYPHINFDLSFNNQAINLIEDDVDLVVRIGNLSEDLNLTRKLLGTQGVTTCASPHYLQKFGTPKTIDELNSHSCISEKNKKGISPWIFASPTGKTTRVSNKSRFYLEGSDACLQMALEDFGIVQLPSWLASEFIKTKKLKAILEDQKATLPINALWPYSSQKTNKKIRVVIDELLKRLGSLSF